MLSVHKKEYFFHKLEFTNVTIYSLASIMNRPATTSFRFFSHGEAGVQTWHRSMEEENNLFLLFVRFTYFLTLSQFLVQQCQLLQKIMLKKLP